MLHYKTHLKEIARTLRKNMSDGERILWSRLRGKQISGLQFYRQKPIGEYIVDFYAPKAKLVIEIDGSQHMEAKHVEKDKIRDAYLNSVGLKVLRFNSREVIKETDAVIERIFEIISKHPGN
jgi:very-short-patch-repair endonuclease